MLRRAALPILLLGAAATAAPGGSDVLLLKDGRVFEGVRMAREEDAVVLGFRNGSVRVPMQRVEDCAIEGAPLPSPATEEERAKRAQGLVPYRGRWVPVAEREKSLRKEIDARRRSIEDYAKHREWRDRYAFRTAHFEFESTQPPGQNQEFSDLLEAYFTEFTKVWGVSVPPKWGRLKACFFGSAQDFHRSATNQPNVLAYYRFVEPRELDFYYDRSDPEMSTACLFHEANHYLTHLINERFCYPHWVNEAMAEYYGASVWDPAKRTMKVGGLQQGRLAEVRLDMEAKKCVNLRDLLSSTTGSYDHYTWGWTLVHFLMESPRYRARFMKFFTDLANAPDVDRKPYGIGQLVAVKDGNEILKAFLSRMGLKESDLPALQKDWYAHIEAMDSTGVRGLEETGIRAFDMGQRLFRAPRLLKEAVEKGSRRIPVYTRYAWCLAMKGEEANRAEAQGVLEKACAVDPLEPEVWAMLGHVKYLSGDQAEGERLLALAREIDPESDYLDNETWIAVQAAIKGGE
jgi:hypothetical protein